MLRRLLRTEVGEVSHTRAWYDQDKLTPHVLRLYKAPLRAQGWGPALVEVFLLLPVASAHCLSSQEGDFVSQLVFRSSMPGIECRSGF